jgi:uncharacterized protein (TIGR00251 family)
MTKSNDIPHSFIVKVSISRQQSRIIGYEKGVLSVSVRARPVNGEANKELLRLLKNAYKKNFIILTGHNSRIKKVLVVSV